MNDHNSFRGTGWIARDAEFRVSQKGTPWVSLNIDIASGDGESRKHCWIDVKVFGEQARRFEGALKGERVCVMARLEQESWLDKTTGAKRNKHVLVADAAFLISDARDSVPANDKPSARKAAPVAAEEEPDYGDIPF